MALPIALQWVGCFLWLLHISSLIVIILLPSINNLQNVSVHSDTWLHLWKNIILHKGYVSQWSFFIDGRVSGNFTTVTIYQGFIAYISVFLQGELTVSADMEDLSNSLFLDQVPASYNSFIVCLVRLFLQLFVWRNTSYSRYFCLYLYSGVQHKLSCIFVLFFVFLCNLCSQCLWIVHF